MKNFKMQFAVILLSAAALMTSCKSNQSGCFYGSNENIEAQKVQNNETTTTQFVVKAKEIEVSE